MTLRETKMDLLDIMWMKWRIKGQWKPNRPTFCDLEIDFQEQDNTKHTNNHSHELRILEKDEKIGKCTVNMKPAQGETWQNSMTRNYVYLQMKLECKAKNIEDTGPHQPGLNAEFC